VSATKDKVNAKFNPGDKVRLKPDPSLVHLFDDATGKRLNG